ncbi:MAG: hypothetical protein AB8U25_03765 [Rickettsiales endosymbiont of Dermacentor nuttalli]
MNKKLFLLCILYVSVCAPLSYVYAHDEYTKGNMLIVPKLIGGGRDKHGCLG